MKWILEFLSLALNRIRSSSRNIFNYGGQNIPQPKNEPSNHISYKNNNQSIGKNMHAQLPIHEAIKKNSREGKEALELIEKATTDEINATNELGQTPLHLAIAAESLGDFFTDFINEIIDMLITKGANVNAKDKDGETAVHYISRWLLNDRSDKDEKVKNLVLSNGDKDKQLISSLKLLIDNKKADVNTKNNKGDTALDYILKSKGYNGYQACNTIETLLKAGAQIKTPEQVFKVIDGSIWHSRNSLEMVKLAISEFDVNYQNQDGNTALSLAYKEKKFDVANFLIEKGANPATIIPSTGKSFITHVIEDNLFDSFPSLKFDVVLENGFTPLTTAIDSGNYDSVKRLVEEHKADVNSSDGLRRKAIHYAAVRGNTGIIEYLLQHGADINSLDGNGSTALHLAAARGNTGIIEYLLQRGADINSLDKNGNTTLHYAAANTNENENIDFLIQKGIDVNCQNENGIRPIYDAIANNHFSNFQTLLNHGASLEMQDFEWVKKIEPLFVISTLMRELPIAQNLFKDERVDHDNILNHRYDYGSNDSQSSGTILHWVAENNRLDTFKILKQYIKGEHINNKHGEFKWTPLHSAVYSNNVEMVKNLLAIDANVLNMRMHYPNPIRYAKNGDIVLMLVEAGADVESELGKHYLARTMIKLVKDGDAKSLEKLLSHKQLKNKIDVNTRDNDNIAILESAVWKGDIETLKILAKYGADANLKSTNKYDNGEVILHNIAQKYSNPKYQAEKNDIKDVMILLILLFNVDPTLRDNNGKPSLDYLDDPGLKKELNNVKELRSNIDKIKGPDATKFILQYFEQDPKKPIADHIKDLSNNFYELMNEYSYETYYPNKKSKISLDDCKVKGIAKENKGCTIL